MKTNLIEKGYVSMEEDDCEQSFKDDIELLAQLMSRLTSRLNEVEKRLSAGSEKRNDEKLNITPKKRGLPGTCEEVGCDKETACKTDKYVLFEKGDSNPKGGVYTFDHLSMVYLEDEMIEATVVEETRCFFRVRVE